MELARLEGESVKLQPCTYNYLFVNGFLSETRLEQDWFGDAKSILSDVNGETYEVVRVLTQTVAVGNEDDCAESVNAVERFCLGESGELEITTVPWAMFKAVMGKHFDDKDTFSFTLDFARKNSPITRDCTRKELSQCPDSELFLSLGSYAKKQHSAERFGLLDNRLVRSPNVDESHSVDFYQFFTAFHNFLCFMKGHLSPNVLSDRDQISEIMNLCLAPSTGLNEIDAIEFYLNGYFSLLSREFDAGKLLSSNENALLRLFDQLRDERSGMIYGCRTSQMPKESVFVNVDENGDTIQPHFSAPSVAMSAFKHYWS